MLKVWSIGDPQSAKEETYMRVYLEVMGSHKGSFKGPFKGIYRDSIRV